MGHARGYFASNVLIGFVLLLGGTVLASTGIQQILPLLPGTLASQLAFPVGISPFTLFALWVFAGAKRPPIRPFIRFYAATAMAAVIPVVIGFGVIGWLLGPQGNGRVISTGADIVVAMLSGWLICGVFLWISGRATVE
jgi:putative flippase GtrA